MGSSLVPIMLIVVLLVGAVVFVVLSSRAPRTGYERGRKRSLETRRTRPGTIPLRDAPDPPAPDSQSPDGVVPGFPAAATASAGAPAAAEPAQITLAGDGPSRATGGAGGPSSGGEPGSAWGNGSAWGDGGWDDSGWDDAGATRVGGPSDSGTGVPEAPGTPRSPGSDTETVVSATNSGGTGGHNVGGAFTSRATSGAAGEDQSHPGAYFTGAAQTGGPGAGAYGTGGSDVSGLDSGGRDTYMNDSRDPDATGWTPPPSGRPHHAEADDAAYRLAVDDRDPLAGGFPHQSSSEYSGPASYPDPTAGETMRIDSAGPSRHGTPGAGGYGEGADTAWGASPAMTAPTVPTPDASAPGLVAAEPAQTTAPALRLAAAGRTRRGKRGGPNEDAYVVSDGLLAVADGVGGEAAGQIASTLTVTTVAGFRPQYAEDPADGLRQAVARANQVVREKPRQEPSWRGMACTLDVVILGRQQATGETLFIAHVGDSSVWLQPQKGRPRQVTTPHAIKNGPLLNAIGLADQIEADILREAVRAGDRVILASDGITKVMTPEQLLGLMTELGPEPPERAADALVEAALLAGARDDTTIVVADLVSEPSAR